MIVTKLVASHPAAVFVQAQEPGDAALQQALKKFGAAKIDAKFLMSPKQQYTLGNNGLPIGRAAFSKSTLQAIGQVTANGDLMVTPRFTEFGGDQPRIGVNMHAFYLTTGRLAALCTATPNASEGVKPVCLDVTPQAAASLMNLHALDFDFNATPAVQQSRILAASKAVVFAPENSTPLLELLKQPRLVLSISSELDDAIATILVRHASTLTLVLGPKVAATTAPIMRLRQFGTKIVKRTADHGGTIVVGQQQSYLGSARLQSLHLKNSRDVGVMLPSLDFPDLRKSAM